MEIKQIQRARYIQNMLVEEASHGQGLNMQLILAELADKDLRTLEQVVQNCRLARNGSRLPEELQVKQTEPEFSYSL